VQTILLSREEVARRARELYGDSIRAQVEVAENIGKMVIIDIETLQSLPNEQFREGLVEVIKIATMPAAASPAIPTIRRPIQTSARGATDTGFAAALAWVGLSCGMRGL
jgi:hypothetical protein